MASLNDEIAFWRTDEDTANPDSEIIGALRPAMATVPGSDHAEGEQPLRSARRPLGRLPEAFRQRHRDARLAGRNPVMNSTVPQSFIDEEVEKDPANAAAEFGAEFRSDIEAFVSPRGRRERHHDRALRDSASAGCQLSSHGATRAADRRTQ